MKFLISSIIVSCLFISCSNHFDFDQAKYSESEIKYISEFEKAFGQIPENHTWDYYAQYANPYTYNYTRAFKYQVQDCEQSNFIDDYSSLWVTDLPEWRNNSNKGQTSDALVSNGEFVVNCVWYYSANSLEPERGFELGIMTATDTIPLFGAYTDENGEPWKYEKYKTGINPGYAARINLGYGREFKFYIKYKSLNGQYLESSSQSKLLYSNIDNDKQILILGFEDTPLSKSNCDKDFNDEILYIVGNPNLPIVQSKRFFCEDLGGKSSDFDFNDIVFDVTPMHDSTDVTIQALGGTLPIKLFVGGYGIAEAKDLHTALRTNHIQANVGANLTIPVYTERIPVKIDNLASFTDVYAKCGSNFDRTIAFKPESKSAVIIAVPVKTKWMKEYTNISFGYPDFFQPAWYDNCNETLVIK